MLTNSRTPVLLLTGLMAVAGTTAQVAVGCPSCGSRVEHIRVEMPQEDPELTVELFREQQEHPVIDVVFVLDTTGSMGGLIEGAKQKIWTIANEIAQTQPTPKIRMGLVGYRDRGDDYVTQETMLTEDLDEVYSALMEFEARGGGDTPESVNEALFNAVVRCDWSEDENALKIVYLVGDAPPKMNYQDDIKYHASCRIAKEKGVLINTIQCGNQSDTRPIWNEIAQLANGTYAAIKQDGGVQRISTPYDDEIHEVDQRIRATMIDYGDTTVMQAQVLKRSSARMLSADSSKEAVADRAMYNYSDAGSKTLYGLQELVNDYEQGKVKLEEIEKEHLPEKYQELSVDELREVVVTNLKTRQELRKVMDDLANHRAQYLINERAKLGQDGFDRQVVESLRVQAAEKGIKLGSQDEQSKVDEGTEPKKVESPKNEIED